jgi:hypothetical protein
MHHPPRSDEQSPRDSANLPVSAGKSRPNHPNIPLNVPSLPNNCLEQANRSNCFNQNDFTTTAKKAKLFEISARFFHDFVVLLHLGCPHHPNAF